MLDASEINLTEWWKILNSLKGIINQTLLLPLLTTYVLGLVNKGNNKITELRTILQRESQNSYLYKQTKSVNNRKTVKKLRHLKRLGGILTKSPWNKNLRLKILYEKRQYNKILR
jgi:hypothetical protein